MLIRKNNLNLHQGKQSISPKNQALYQNNYHSLCSFIKEPQLRDFQELTNEELIQTIKRKDQQIQKLFKLIQNYKKKINQFSQYEQVLKDFVSQKPKQKVSNQSKKVQKMQDERQLFESLKAKLEPTQKSFKRTINLSFSIAIICQKQKQIYENNQTQKNEKICLSLINSLCSTTNDNDQTIIQSRNKSITRQKFGKSYFGKQKAINQNEKSFIKFNKQNLYPDEESSMQEFKKSFIQRVPSLDNLRRIQKCFKLLKS